MLAAEIVATETAMDCTAIGRVRRDRSKFWQWMTRDAGSADGSEGKSERRRDWDAENWSA